MASRQAAQGGGQQPPFPPPAWGWGIGQSCWVGTAPVHCLDWAEPNLMLVPRAWQAVAGLLACAGPSPPPPGGVRAPEQRGQHPFSGLWGPLCCPPAHRHPAGALAGVVMFQAVALLRMVMGAP